MLRRILPIAVALSAAVLAGCRVDPYAEVREREWRRLEDEIYYRDSMIADLEDQLDSCRRENDALRRRRGTAGGPSELLPTPKGDANGVQDDVSPDEMQDFEPPKTELGDESPPPLGRVPPPRRTNVLLTAKNEPGTTATVPRPLPSAALDPNAASSVLCGPAASLKLNRRITGGADTDGRFGDEGIFALVEARDAAGRLVSDPGAMTLVLHDPLASGDRGVVARWDFTAHEVASRFRAGPFGSGVHFDLPWPNRPPSRSQLRLEVRLTTADGKTLATTHKFSVDLANAPRATAASDRPDDAASTPAKAAAADDNLPPWRPSRDPPSTSSPR